MRIRISIIFLTYLIVFACSGQYQKYNQQYSDDILRIFFDQSRTYETQIKPMLNQKSSDSNKEIVINIWSKSISGFIEKLNSISDDNVDSTLVNMKHQIINTSTSIIPILTKPSYDRNDMELFMLLERLGSQQLEFEIRAMKLGLDIYSSGVQ